MAKDYADLAEYCRTDVDINVPVRYTFCPFCERTIKADGFIVWRTFAGWKCYCHRCNTYKFVRRKGVAPPSAILAAVNAPRIASVASDRVIYLPEDFEPYTPISAKKWLYLYGVTDEEIKRFRFGYSPSMDRLILPVFDGEKLVFWQGRKLNKDLPGPKYLSMKASRKTTFFELISDPTQPVVLVEDIISALAIRRAGYNVVSLLGSYVGDSLAKRLQTLGVKRVCIWLDPDKRTEAVRYTRRLNSLGFKAGCIITAVKDPKEYGTNQINNFLYPFMQGEKYEHLTVCHSSGKDLSSSGAQEATPHPQQQAQVPDS